MYSMCKIILTLLVLPTSIYSAAGTEGTESVCIKGASGSGDGRETLFKFVIENNTRRGYWLTFTKGTHIIKKTFIGIEEPAVELIQCPKDFDIVTFSGAHNRKYVVAFSHAEVKEIGPYRIDEDLISGIYFTDLKARRKLLPVTRICED